MNSSIKKDKGFTIIEVVLVLAIAGLIFLVVFLALPQLQKSQRDEQRRADVGRVVAAVNTYKSNNNGSLPTLDTTFASTYLAADSSFKGPSTSGDYAWVTSAVAPATTNPNALAVALDTVYVMPGGKCNPAGVASSFVAGSTGNRAIVVKLETGGSYCQTI